MQIATRIAMLLALLGSASSGQAMYINPLGTGEVLFFPYYTVNANQTTLLTLTNTTGNAKALTIEVTEGYNNRTVFQVDVYLGAYDSWTSAIGGRGETLPAFLLTHDTSCTSPDKPRWTAEAGGYSLLFVLYPYTTDNEDYGPRQAWRTHEGQIRVVERAELRGAYAAAVDSEGPRDCARLDPVDLESPDLQPPSGGVRGSFAIVDVAQGTLFGGAATAIADYTTFPLYMPYDGWHWLGYSSSAPGITRADLPDRGGAFSLSYGNSGPSQAIDAVSALLTADSLQAEITREASVGSFTEWVLSAPTKHWYTDNQILGVALGQPGAIAPYEKTFGQDGLPGACTTFTADGFDREGRAVRFGPLSGSSTLSLCHATDVVQFGAPAANGRTPLLGSRLGVSVWNPQPLLESGVARLDFSRRSDGTPRILRPDLGGTSLRGLPLIGFSAIKYINANVLPGVLANYTYLQPLQAPNAVCTTAQGQTRDCR